MMVYRFACKAQGWCPQISGPIVFEDLLQDDNGCFSQPTTQKESMTLQHCVANRLAHENCLWAVNVCEHEPCAFNKPSIYNLDLDAPRFRQVG